MGDGISQGLDRLLGKLRFKYLGLGLMWLWIFGLWFTPAIFFDVDSQARTATWLISLFASAATLFAASFLWRGHAPLRSVAIAVSSIGTCVTTIAFMFLPVSPLLYANATLSGIFAAVLWLLWGELYGSISSELVESCTPASVAVVLVGIPLAAYLSWPLSGIFVASFPIISGVFLLFETRGSSNPSPVLLEEKKRRKIFPHVIALDAGAMLCSMANGFVLVMLTSRGPFIPDVVVCVIIGAMAAMMISLVTVLFSRRVDFLSFFLWVLPILITGLAVLASGVSDIASVAASCGFVVVFTSDCLFWIIFSDVSHKGMCSPFEAFGLNRGCIQMGCFIGSLIGLRIMSAGVSSLVPCLVFICVCSVVFPLVVGQQNSLQRIIASESAQALVEEKDNKLMKALVRKYKLSPREADVLDLLRKGRTVPYIRDALYISKSTIETHIKHIYAKMGVHSKQELIDIVENHE